ncbi:MAG: PilZ domain-containing protein [Vicinamibacteria bacterium]|jgi:hypothetical protein|nr:PilZ domain-containing protein [Vicinamibacteria bacterium]
MASNERRRYPRIRLDGRLAGRATLMADFKVLSLSETGAMLRMKIPMAMGSQCDLTLLLSHVSVDLKGHVVHIGPAKDGDEYFTIGVDFVRVQPIDRALLASYLERERRRS